MLGVLSPDEEVHKVQETSTQCPGTHQSPCYERRTGGTSTNFCGLLSLKNKGASFWNSKLLMLQPNTIDLLNVAKQEKTINTFSTEPVSRVARELGTECVKLVKPLSKADKNNQF